MNKKSVRIVSAEFTSFKALRDFQIQISDVNVLVGPNNCGESTIISAFRALDVAIRRARTKTPERMSDLEVGSIGYTLSADALPLSLENVHTDYQDKDSKVLFRLSNDNELTLLFPRTGGCRLIPKSKKRLIQKPTHFRAEFPVSLGVVPILGPVEHRENLVQEETVRRNVGSHRASRNFRNYWRLYPKLFDAFASLVCETWPSMEILPPEIVIGPPATLAMFCKEDGITRELFWSGFGFQIWCQLLTHITRARDDTLLVIDEPEIYLHPDIQRQLMGILRDAGPDILLATHSSEMITDAEVQEILDVDKTKRRARRLRDIQEVQTVLESIGSIHNVTLTKIARTRRVLFVEGLDDFRRIRRFAKRMGLKYLAQGTAVSPVESGGFSSWPQVRHMARMLEKTLGTTLKIAAVYDRDFWCQEEIDIVSRDLSSAINCCHFHQRKEIENYLLEPEIINKTLRRTTGNATIDARAIIEEVSGPFKTETLAQYLSKKAQHYDRTRKDASTINKKTIEWFEDKWSRLEERMEIAPGKEVLSQLRSKCKSQWNASLTDAQIIDSFSKDELPSDLKQCLTRLEEFCAT